MATPIAAPTTGDDAETTPLYGARNPKMENLDSWLRIKPMISEENSHSPMADSASMI